MKRNRKHDSSLEKWHGEMEIELGNGRLHASLRELIPSLTDTWWISIVVLKNVRPRNGPNKDPTWANKGQT